jgi:hypothetical protein
MLWIGTDLGLTDISRAKTIKIDYDQRGDAVREFIRILAPAPNEKKYGPFVWHNVASAFIPEVKRLLGPEVVEFLQGRGRARLRRREEAQQPAETVAAADKDGAAS